MKEMLIKAMIPLFTKIIIDMLTPKNFKKAGKAFLTLIKNYVQDTETKWDDKLILPVIEVLEAYLDTDAE